jgi:ankyrin repeat protein
MTSFSQLPNEIIVLVAKAISHQKDLSAMVRTNRRLYDLLHAYLCRFNIQHHQASGLLFAAENGRCSLSKKFLDAGASIASFGPQSEHDEWKGWNPLEAAAQTRHTETLKTLLAESRPGRTYTPAQLRNLLQDAIEVADQEVVDLMINHHAPLGPSKHSEHYCLVHSAIRARSEAVLELLLQAGVKPVPERLVDVFEFAAERKGNYLQKLLDYGVRPNWNLVLATLVYKNELDAIRLLIEYGADIRVHGQGLIFVAINVGSKELIEFLLQQGANPYLCMELTPGKNRSTIWCAIKWRKFDILELLLAHGVCSNQQDLQLAIDMELPDIVAMLEKISYGDAPRE